MEKDNFEFTNSPFVNRNYEKFYKKHGYIPTVFNPYNCTELSMEDVAPTITTQCGSITSSASVLIIEQG